MNSPQPFCLPLRLSVRHVCTVCLSTTRSHRRLAGGSQASRGMRPQSLSVFGWCTNIQHRASFFEQLCWARAHFFCACVCVCVSFVCFWSKRTFLGRFDSLCRPDCSIDSGAGRHDQLQVPTQQKHSRQQQRRWRTPSPISRA